MEQRMKRPNPVLKNVELKIKDEHNIKPINKFNERVRKHNNVTIVYPEQESKKIAKIIYSDGDSKKVTPYLRPELKGPTILPRPPQSQKDEIKPKYRTSNEISKEFINKRFIDLRKIREKYTTKLKNPNVPVKPNEVKKEEINKVPSPKLENKIVPPSEPKKPSEETPPPKEKHNSSSKGSDSTKEKKTAPTNKKNPVIKTITTRSGAVKVYKEVTFAEKKQLTPLEIKIPTVNVKKQSSKLDTQSYVSKEDSKVSVKEVKIKKEDFYRRKSYKKREQRKHRHRSRDSFESCCKSPQTEVARWVPTSVTQHTRPYYEAWVDTTLTATSKYTTKEKLRYEKKNLMRNLKNLLERPSSPELTYTRLGDERYTGRIKIKQR